MALHSNSAVAAEAIRTRKCTLERQTVDVSSLGHLAHTSRVFSLSEHECPHISRDSTRVINGSIFFFEQMQDKNCVHSFPHFASMLRSTPAGMVLFQHPSSYPCHRPAPSFKTGQENNMLYSSNDLDRNSSYPAHPRASQAQS